MSMIKKNAQTGAQEQLNYNSKYLTMQLRDYNDPFYQRQLQRRIKRHKAQKRRELIGNIASWTAGLGMLAIFWIAMTGVWG